MIKFLKRKFLQRSEEKLESQTLVVNNIDSARISAEQNLNKWFKLPRFYDANRRRWILKVLFEQIILKEVEFATVVNVADLMNHYSSLSQSEVE